MLEHHPELFQNIDILYSFSHFIGIQSRIILTIAYHFKLNFLPTLILYKYYDNRVFWYKLTWGDKKSQQKYLLFVILSRCVKFIIFMPDTFLLLSSFLSVVRPLATQHFSMPSYTSASFIALLTLEIDNMFRTQAAEARLPILVI